MGREAQGGSVGQEGGARRACGWRPRGGRGEAHGKGEGLPRVLASLLGPSCCGLPAHGPSCLKYAEIPLNLLLNPISNWLVTIFY